MPDQDDDFQPTSRILLVDDEQNILASLTRLLEEEDGFEVFSAQSGAAGLALLEQEPINLIISDMRMPEMNGAEFLSLAAKSWPDTGRILLTGFADINSTIQAVNEGRIHQYISKPWNDEDLIQRIHSSLEVQHLREYNKHLEKVREKQNKQLLVLTEQQEATIKNRTAELEQTASQLEVAYQELQETYFQTVPLLAHLVELNERNKKNHAKRVAKISKLIAKKMELSDHEIRQIFFGALLHDIGKIGIEQSILSKSHSNLSPVELRRYQQHSLLGETALLSFDPLRDAAQIIRCHHERFDGKGFPSKLSGANIPLGARIVAIANDYDNLQLPNNFHGRALSDTQAHEIIISESGKRYDPTVVEVFDNVIEQVRKLLSKDKEVVLTLDKVTAGMKLSQDLVNHHGMVMLAAGKALTEAHISKLKQFETAFHTRLQIAIKHHTSTNL
jgi:response regulator RpfG family c-di-GMP phosphodiesterase